MVSFVSTAPGGSGPGAGPALAKAAVQLMAPVSDSLNVLRSEAAAIFVRSEQPVASDFEALRPTTQAILRSFDGSIFGCGFMAAPGVLAWGRLFQEWWTLLDGEVEQVNLDFDSRSESFYDYSLKEYFCLPAETGAPHVEGPYVDYLCTQEYILTMALPVSASGHFTGVVGADISLEHLQRELLDRDVVHPGKALSLVNKKGRVIFSTVSRLEPGAMVRDPELSAWFATKEHEPSRTSDFHIWPCAGLPWAVLAFDRDQ